MSSPVAAQTRPSAVVSNGATRLRPAAPARRMLVVAPDAGRERTLAALRELGYVAEAAPDPYAAVARLARDRGEFAGLVLSLAGIFTEELSLIQTLKRLGRLEVVVCDMDGRGAEFAEAMRLGADALLAGGFLHRLAPPPTPAVAPEPVEPARDDATLTPDELRALLGDDA